MMEVHLIPRESDRRRQYLTDYARMLGKLDERERALSICRQVLSESLARPPRTCEDFYYDGLANHLLGRVERANYDFERSRGVISVPYHTLSRPLLSATGT